jgi:hypothetical protein
MIAVPRAGWQSIAAGFVLLVTTGCHPTTSDFCFEIDGPCYTGGEMPLEYYVAGFPIDRVDTTSTMGSGGQPLTLQVGEHVSLYLVHLTGDARGIDTLRSISWTITNDSAVRIANGIAGAGILTAVHVGTAGTVLANDSVYEYRACNAYFCRRVSEVDVVSP